MNFIRIPGAFLLFIFVRNYMARTYRKVKEPKQQVPNKKKQEKKKERVYDYD